MVHAPRLLLARHFNVVAADTSSHPKLRAGAMRSLGRRALNGLYLVVPGVDGRRRQAATMGHGLGVLMMNSRDSVGVGVLLLVDLTFEADSDGSFPSHRGIHFEKGANSRRENNWREITGRIWREMNVRLETPSPASRHATCNAH